MCKNRFVDVDAMTDEEIDRMFDFTRSNTLKSAAPLYIYLVLQNHSGPRRHLTQQEILDYVEEEYDVKMERKALSRWLHLLITLNLDVYSDPRYGTWMEK